MDDSRRWHYLQPCRGQRQPSTIVCVDTETYPDPHPTVQGAELHRFRLGAATADFLQNGHVVCTRRIRFSRVDEFWAFLDGCLRRGKSTYVFAHGLGFDLRVLNFFSYLESGEFQLDGANRPPCGDSRVHRRPTDTWRGLLVDADPPTIVIVRRNGVTVRCVDTRNYYPSKLADLGRRVALAKMPMPDPQALDDVWFTYCERDTEIVRLTMLRHLDLLRRHNLGSFRLTAAAQAWQAFRNRLQPRSVLIHAHREALALERAAYYGGLNQAWYMGDVSRCSDLATLPQPPPASLCGRKPVGPVYELDVRSFYPSILINHPVPVRLIRWGHGTVDDIRRQLEAGRGCIARVKLDVCSQVFPVVHNGRTVHAEGTFTTVLGGCDLMNALALDCVRSVSEVAVYEMGYPLRDYCEDVLQIRQAAEKAGDMPCAELAKLLANSAQGKFGQRLPRWTDRPDMTAPVPWGCFWRQELGVDKLTLYRALGWHVQQATEPGEAPDSFPAVCAFITAWGRWKLHSFRQVAGAFHSLYCDTDSIHVDQVGYDRLQAAGLVEHGRPGFLQIKRVAEDATYWGLKHYRVGDRLVIGGVARASEYIGQGWYRQMQFDRLRSSLHRGPDGKVMVRPVCKRVNRSIPPGRVTPEGWSVPGTLGGDS